MGIPGRRRKSIASATTHLKANMDDFTATLRSAGFRHLTDAIRLFPEFDVVRGGYYARVAT